MKNNFNFNASIKMKDLDKMEKSIELLTKEKIENEDLKICLAFESLLSKFDDEPKIKMFELVDAFADFYEDILYPYCKGKIICERFDEFDFEQVQYVMDKMKEIIYTIAGQYGL